MHFPALYYPAQFVVVLLVLNMPKVQVLFHVTSLHRIEHTVGMTPKAVFNRLQRSGEEQVSTVTEKGDADDENEDAARGRQEFSRLRRASRVVMSAWRESE
jgi:hypothetical protein